MAKKTLLAGNIASDDDILRYASALDLPTMATPEAQPAKKGGFFESAGSGISTAFKQIPQLAYGLGAIGAAGIESMAGEGGIATALKQGAVDKYLDWSKKIQADSSENYEWDTAYGKAKEGDIGALVDFLGYGIGYGLGQGAQILASAGVGGAVAKTVGREAVEKMASGMVAKEAAELAAKNAALPAAQRVAAAEINKLAVSNVATKIGQNAAIGASAFGMEGGEIGGDLVAENRDRELTGSELVRALGATALAGGFEFAGDRLGLSALTGKIGFGKNMTGIGGRAVRAGTGAIAAAPGEFATEYMQTGVENWGKGKEDSLLTWQQSEEAQREAINAGALGAVGGGTYGIIGGALSKAQQDQPVVPASVPATASAQTPATPASQPAPSLTDIAAAPTVEDAIATFDAIVSAPVGRDEGMFNLADLEPELKQSGILGSVLGMPAFTTAANPTTTSPLPQTPVAMPGALADIAGVSELSALVEQERADKQARLAAEIARMRQRSQPGEASVVEAPEAVQAEAQGAQAPAANRFAGAAYGITNADPLKEGDAPLSVEDADFALESMIERAQRGKLTPAQFAQSDVGQRIDMASMQVINAGLRADPVATLTELRDAVARQRKASIATPATTEQSLPVAPTFENPNKKGAEDASFVIRNKKTGQVVREVENTPKNRAALSNLNTEKYEAVGITAHLESLNQPSKQEQATVAKKETVASAPQAPAAPAAKTKPQSVGDAIKAEADGAAARDGAGLVREERDAQTRADKASAWKAKHAGNRFETIAARDIVASDHENLAGVVRSGKVTAERAVEMIDDAAASGVLDAKVAGYMKQKVAQAPAAPAQSTIAPADTQAVKSEGKEAVAAPDDPWRESSIARGYDTEVELDARALKAAFERDRGEPLAWSEDKTGAVRKGAKSNGLPEVTIGARGIGINDGRHRIAVAAERGESIKAMVPAAEVEAIQRALQAGAAVQPQPSPAPALRVDVPSESWLQDNIDYAKAQGRNAYGVPYMGKVTASYRAPINVSVQILAKLRGQRGEQDNVRPADLAAIKKIMQETGKLPLTDRGTEYVPYIEVAHDGSAWVSEGNHRIMAAAELGWDTLPVEIRYFDGGERIDGPLNPETITPPRQEPQEPSGTTTNQPAPAVDQAAPAVNQAPQLYRPAIADFFASLPNDHATAEETAAALAKTDLSAADKASIQRVQETWMDTLIALETKEQVTIKC